MHKTPRMRTCSEEERTPRLRMLYIVFLPFTYWPIIAIFCFCHLYCLCNMISTGRKTNKPRGRASAVSTISMCFFMLLFTAHSPTNLCEKGWGYHCCVLVWLLALFAKLNRFFQKMEVNLVESESKDILVAPAIDEEAQKEAAHDLGASSCLIGFQEVSTIISSRKFQFALLAIPSMQLGLVQ